MIRFAALFMIALSALIGCSGGGGGSKSYSGSTFTTGRDTPARIAIDDYLNQVVIPVLVNIDNSALALRNQIAVFLANPSEANLASTKAAWVAARVPWQRNQSTNFGPIVSGDFNARLDSWPIDTDQIQIVLHSQADLSENAVATFAGPLKGYHVIEYLLWGENGIKRGTEITQREASLLTSVAAVLRKDVSALLAAWNRDDNPYALEVALAGQGSETFSTEDSMLETAVQGMIAVLNQLADQELAEDDFRQVESHYSGNSLNEFVDVVVGARDIYNISISTLVEDEEVDLKVRGEFELAINALRLIPEPFDAAINNPANDNRINNARQRIRNLSETLQNEVNPIVIEQIQPVTPENEEMPESVSDETGPSGSEGTT